MPICGDGGVYSLSCSCIWLFATTWTVAHQVPLSLWFFQARILEWVAMSANTIFIITVIVSSSSSFAWLQISIEKVLIQRFPWEQLMNKVPTLPWFLLLNMTYRIWKFNFWMPCNSQGKKKKKKAGRELVSWREAYFLLLREYSLLLF